VERRRRKRREWERKEWGRGKERGKGGRKEEKKGIREGAVKV